MTSTINEKIIQLKTRQSYYVGEWEEYDRLGEVLDELTKMRNE